MHTYILLDRTGSMSSIWTEALGSVNAYAKRFGEMGPEDTRHLDTKLTLAVFDAQGAIQFDVLRRNVDAADWRDVTEDEAHPRGMTPLFDAVGRLVSLAEQDAPDKAMIVIMTDGLENASRELRLDGVRQALKRCEARGWEIVFLGADFVNFSDARSIGVDAEKSMGLAQGRFDKSMRVLASASRDYGYGRRKNVVFSKSDREIAAEKDVKRGKS